MKDFNMLIWLTQLGLSIVLPLAGFTLIGVWLHSSLGVGRWVIGCCLVLGLISAASGLKSSLKAMERMSSDRKQQSPPPVSFNDHK